MSKKPVGQRQFDQPQCASTRFFRLNTAEPWAGAQRLMSLRKTKFWSRPGAVQLARVAFGLFIFALWTLGVAVDVGTAAEQQDVGERVVDFELPVVGSEEYLSLSDEYEQGAVVVVVLRGYPGYQCPVCSRQVGSLANRAKGLAGQAHRVILVYPGEGTLLKRHAEQFMGSRSLPQPLVLVRDDEMKMVASWGLRWRAHRETAYPATYIIDRNGRIRWKKVSESHAGRSTVEEILKELRKL